MRQLLIGGIAIAAWIAALMFFRFFRRSHDRFFAYFGWAFVLEGLNRIPEAFTIGTGEVNPFVYLVRLLA